MLGEIVTENCCAELITISIARALENQPIFQHHSSTQWLRLISGISFSNTALQDT